ncbi:MAG: hypothetical protein LBU23_05325 [Planctomycetota bacterium]|nr:hypothetical protein [Planctomycetota bacterium]
MTHARFASARLGIAIVCLLLPAGCDEARRIGATLGSSSKPYQEFLEDPVALTAIKTIAIVPFADQAPQPGFDADVFANKLANQLAAHGKMRIIFPAEMLAVVDSQNRAAYRHNAQLRERRSIGLDTSEEGEGQAGGGIFAADDGGGQAPRRYLDPVKNVEEAVRLARLAKADAVIVGEVSDIDPYMRPRLTLSLRLIATGNSESAARAIAELSQWGVPRTPEAASGVVYIRQESFDSRIGSVGLDVSRYGLTHLIDDHPYDTELYVRSMTHYYDVVASQLARSYMEVRKKAVAEAEKRAREAAKAAKRDQAAAAKRLFALMERDSRIPDYEADARGEGWFDQSFPDRRAVVGANGGDNRIQSWRPEGRDIRPASAAERLARDGRVPENERGRGLEGYSTMADSSFPDADELVEMNLMNARDRSWRPDYYNHANPQKSAPLYAPEQFRAGETDRQ